MIPSGVALGVNRIVTTFGDVGVSNTISGSGFWLETYEKKSVFVTNRHNVDPDLRPRTKGYKTTNVRIELRTDPDGADPRVETFRIANLNRCLFVSEKADCAILMDPSLEGFAEPFQLWMTASEWYLAGDHDDVWRWLDIGDLATFIGFAGGGADAKSRWWDQKRSFPIGRLASLSSHPGVAFEHPSIVTADAGLVSGLSFAGASGSPLLSHAKWGGSAGFGEPSFDDHVAESKNHRHHVWPPRGGGGGLVQSFRAVVLHTRPIHRCAHQGRQSFRLRERETTPLRLSRARSRRLKQTRARAIDGRRRLPIAHAVRQPMQTPSAP